VSLSLSQYKRLILDKVNLIEVLNKVNPDEYYEEGRPCFCPFHDNENTPAAAIYGDDDYMTLYCFSERKLYTVIDALEKLLGVDPYIIGERLWSKLSDNEKSDWLLNNKSEQLRSSFDEDIEKDDNDNKLDIYKEKYKSGKITIQEFLKSRIKK
jgi:hypothetical protein